MIVYWKYKIWYKRFKLYINLKHQTSVQLCEVPITHSRNVQILIYLFDLSPRKRFVYLLEIVDHICCFFVGWTGHVKSLRFHFRVDFLNHLIIILPVLGHCQKLYFFSALWKKGKKTHLTSDRLARLLLIHRYLTSLLFFPEVGYYKLGVCPTMWRGGGGNGAMRLGKV